MLLLEKCLIPRVVRASCSTISSAVAFGESTHLFGTNVPERSPCVGVMNAGFRLMAKLPDQPDQRAGGAGPDLWPCIPASHYTHLAVSGAYMCKKLPRRDKYYARRDVCSGPVQSNAVLAVARARSPGYAARG